MADLLYPVGTKILRVEDLTEAGEVVRATVKSVWMPRLAGGEERLISAWPGDGVLAKHGSCLYPRYVVNGSAAHARRVQQIAAERDYASVLGVRRDAVRSVSDAAARIVGLLDAAAAERRPSIDCIAKIERIRDAAVSALAALEAEHGT